MKTVILSVLVLALIFGIATITPVFALEKNGVIKMPFTANIPLIDGVWTTPDEWKDAEKVDGKTTDHEMITLVKHDRDFIYIMADVISNYYSNSYLLRLSFDTNNDGENTMQGDDFRITFGRTGAAVDVVELGTFIDGEYQKMDFPTGLDYKIGFSSVNDPYESEKNHKIYEARIPISLLHKSDIYGFGISNVIVNLLGRSINWPPNHELDAPSTFGSLVAADHSITNPPSSISPLKQFKSGVPANAVECREGLLLVIKSRDGSPACVQPLTYNKLAERGWANLLGPQTTFYVFANDTRYEISYHVTGWRNKILNMTADLETNSLTVSMQNKNKGELIVTIPKTLFDAKTSPEKNTDFFVLIDGEESEIKSKKKTDIDTTLTIGFSEVAKKIEIIQITLV